MLLGQNSLRRLATRTQTPQLGTNWIHPLYELPVTGGFPG